ncbi:hypothetical protein J2T59_001473 [Methanosalsum natronophilum]|nr:hypothetical protein [Methanosalsum natronophilum]
MFLSQMKKEKSDWDYYSTTFFVILINLSRTRSELLLVPNAVNITYKNN